MRYMLLCYDDEKYWEHAGEAVLKAGMDEAVALAHELAAKGQYVLAAPLQSSSTATSVRSRDGKTVVTDGPFAETREVLGGFYILEAENLDQAIAAAARHPGARFGTVEVRPIMELSGLPEPRI
jgi:hypothetical protein